LDSIQILHTSDTHLGHRQYGLSEREMDVYDAFGEIVDIAIREHVDAVIHSGDFFDSVSPPPQAYYHAINHLRRLREKDIPLVVVPGDHDIPKRRVLPPLLVLERLGLLHILGLREPEKRDLRTSRGKLRVSGFRNIKGPGARQQLLQALVRLGQGSDYPSVLILHQSLRNVSPDYELELGELPKGYSYYALGHIHVYRKYVLGESAVIYPGSPEALRRDEAEEQPYRYVVIAEIARKRTVSSERVKLNSTRPQLVYRHLYREANEFKTFLASIREEILKAGLRSKKKPIVHIIIENIPKREKTTIYDTIEKLLRPHTLTLRIQATTIDTSLPRTVQESTSSIDHYKILKEMLGNEDLAKLALELIDALSMEPKQVALDQAEKLLQKYFNIEV